MANPRIQEILGELQEASQHPVRSIQKYNVEGKKCIGAAPYFAPLELIHAADMYPVELWGGDITPSEAHKYYPVFYCSVLLSLMELGLRGDYDFLSGIIIPTTCDGLRNLEENWSYARPNMPVISLVQPVNRKSVAGERYHVAELHHVQEELEKICGHKILERDIYKSIQVYNRQKAAMRAFDALCNDHLDIFTPINRHWVFKSSRVMPVEVHTALVEELNQLLAAEPVFDFKGLRFIVSALIMDSEEMLKALEEENIAIVGDDMAAGIKRFEVDAPDHVDPMVSLARVMPNIEGCSVLYDPKKSRGPLLAKLAEERKADAVLMSIIKFCEEEEFDYPILRKQLKEADVPLLAIEVEDQGHIDEQAKTRIQAFAEMLG